MNMEPSAFIYDSKANSLLVFREDRVNYYFIRLGEIVIGFDKKMRIASVEILNPDILYSLSKNKLSKINSVRLSAQSRGSMLLVLLLLEFDNKEVEKIPINVSLEKPIPC